MASNTTVEIFYDAAWHDITADVAAEGGRVAVINRARRDESSQVDPGSCDLAINNRRVSAGSPQLGWKYTPRNPHSPLYGKIGRNTPIRVKYNGTVRFSGEIPAWPQSMSTGGVVAVVPVKAAGIMRRLGQGGSTPKSAPRRYVPSTNPVAYWPLEEGTDAKQAEPLNIPGIDRVVGPLRSTVSSAPVLFGEGEVGDWLPNGAKGTVAAGYPTLYGNISDVPAVDADDWAVDVIFHTHHSDGGFKLKALDAGGRVAGDPGYDWEITTFGDSNYYIQLHVTEDDGTPTTTLLATSVALDALQDLKAHHLRMTVTQNGTGVDYNIYVDGINVVTGTRASTSNHGVTAVQLQARGNTGNVTAWGHLVVWHDITSTGTIPSVTTAAQVALGSIGETAGRRIERLCSEEDVAFTSVGDLDESEGMGAQGVAGFLNLVRECAEADMGFLYEPRATLGLAYRTRVSLYNQSAAASFTYGSRVLSVTPVPVDDDQHTRNQVAVSRSGGSSHTAELTLGALSTQAPPNGVGVYDESVTVNIAGDGVMLQNQAGWRVHLGTVDEERYPDIGFHGDTAAGLDLGDRFVINSLPGKPSGEQVSQIAQGFTEILHRTRREIVINGAPESPYQVAKWVDPTTEPAASFNRWDHGQSTLSTGIDSDDTSLSIAIPTGYALWTIDNALDGFDINIGGERMTVTDISGASSPQTFVVTRSVNGVVKPHSSGAAVRLWQPPRWAL